MLDGIRLLGILSVRVLSLVNDMTGHGVSSFGCKGICGVSMYRCLKASGGCRRSQRKMDLKGIVWVFEHKVVLFFVAYVLPPCEDAVLDDICICL